VTVESNRAYFVGIARPIESNGMDRLEQYREFREAGKRLNARMLEDAVAPEAIRAAAEQLGIAHRLRVGHVLTQPL